MRAVSEDSELFALGTAHGMWWARLMILRSHLFNTATCRVHVRNIGYLACRWTRSALLLPTRAISGVWATCLRLFWVSSGGWATSCGGEIATCCCGFCRLRGGCCLCFMPLCDNIHDSGDLHELRLGEFAKDGLKLGPLDKTCQLEVILSAVL